MYIISVFDQEPFNSCILTTIIDNVERNYTRTLRTDEDPEDTRHNIASLFTYVNKIKQTKQIRTKTATHVTKLLLKTLACINIIQHLSNNVVCILTEAPFYFPMPQQREIQQRLTYKKVVK